MKPWAQCASDAERLDVHNGLLLAVDLDAAFDPGLVSFEDDGTLLVSPALDPTDRQRLGLAALPRLEGMRPAHRPYLAFHREGVFDRPGCRE
jgi:predicted restriction endonuclease